MLINRYFFFHVLIIIFVCTTNILGKSLTEDDSTFALSAEFGLGGTINLSEYKISLRNSESAPYFKLFWKPNHKLNIGLETTYLHIENISNENMNTEFGNTDFSVDMNAIPITLLFDMEVLMFNLTGGLGVSYLESTIDAFETKVKSNIWSMCYSIALSYTYKPYDNLGIGIEMKAYSFPKIDRTIAGVSLKLCYDFLRW